MERSSPIRRQAEQHPAEIGLPAGAVFWSEPDRPRPVDAVPIDAAAGAGPAIHPAGGIENGGGVSHRRSVVFQERLLLPRFETRLRGLRGLAGILQPHSHKLAANFHTCACKVPAGPRSPRKWEPAGHVPASEKMLITRTPARGAKVFASCANLPRRPIGACPDRDRRSDRFCPAAKFPISAS